MLGGVLSYLAVGCPVCNKIALLALGYSGALRWFAPAQPWLAAAGVGLLAYAFHRRLRGEIACAAPARKSYEHDRGDGPPRAPRGGRPVGAVVERRDGNLYV
jgi:hypothetical protein